MGNHNSTIILITIILLAVLAVYASSQTNLGGGEYFGVIYSLDTGRIRRVIKSSSQEAFVLAAGEGILKLPEADYKLLPFLQELVYQKTGIAPKEDRYAVVDNFGKVEGIIEADILFDSIPNKELVKSQEAEVGYVYSSQTGFINPKPPEPFVPRR